MAGVVTIFVLGFNAFTSCIWLLIVSFTVTLVPLKEMVTFEIGADVLNTSLVFDKTTPFKNVNSCSGNGCETVNANGCVTRAQHGKAGAQHKADI